MEINIEEAKKNLFDFIYDLGLDENKFHYIHYLLQEILKHYENTEDENKLL